VYTLDSVSCADTYGTANLGPAYQGSGGGYAAVSDNDAYMQISYGAQGQTRKLTQMHVPVGTLAIPPLPSGAFVQFRNYVVGSVAVVSGALAEAREPAIVLGAGGISNTTSSMVTGIIPAAGTTPTAGTGFTYTHTNGTGIYVFTFTTAFAAAPTIELTLGPAAHANLIPAQVTVSSPQGFTVQIKTLAGAAADAAFMFVALTTL
jgi:hypothetical protein